MWGSFYVLEIHENSTFVLVIKTTNENFHFFRRLVGIINNSFTWCCSLVWVHMCSLYNEKAVGFMFVITHSWLIKGYNYSDYTFNWLSYTNVTIFPRNAYRWISNQSAHFFFSKKYFLITKVNSWSPNSKNQETVIFPKKKSFHSLFNLQFNCSLIFPFIEKPSYFASWWYIWYDKLLHILQTAQN